MDPVRAIYIAALCLILLGGVLTLQSGEVHSGLLLLPAIAAAAAYSLSPQLRWWYWKRNPPDLPTALAPILDRFPLYRSLDLEGKREFRRRTFLIREATDFQGMAIDNIPADVRLMVAASAASVTYFRDDFLIPGFENVVFYPHQFPTPEHDVLHASELYAPDGVIIWTLKYFIRSAIEPDKYLQLGIYEYARALFHTDPEVRARVEPHQLNYEDLYLLTGFSESALKTFIGLDELDLAAISLTVWHTHAPPFAAQFGERYAAMSGVFSPVRS